MAAADSNAPQRFRLDLAYDGTDFAGWAKQPGLSTVAGTLLAAIEVILGPDNSDFGLRVAGRTDAGVHAASQVAQVDVTRDQLKRAGRTGLTALRLNSLLPNAVRVLAIMPVPADFDARFAATQRHYRYRIANQAASQLPENARFTLWHATPLDEDAMQQAAAVLIGVHDFAAFCKRRAGATTIRELREIKIRRDAAGIIDIELTADAFCHNMVRSLVGALIAVGEGRISDDQLGALLESKTRSSLFKVVPPHGLTLTAVDYPPSEAWQRQILKAKNRRDSDGN